MSQNERWSRPISQKPTVTFQKKSQFADSSGWCIASSHQPDRVKAADNVASILLPSGALVAGSQRARSSVAQTDGAMHSAATRALPIFFGERWACGR